ncbi:Flavin monooxygenase-like protein [Cordyceps fumosorosea ARSEF 2679]|uniref:Flavin monooxygenase-like protein n=1 Tax=Cordyceps fumosorosea (strain ARSEF 2679) TaxID=1081104 RepID=A0A166VUS7_CORFA|nr:Flavin monooxygenase-like protein [Cordyceps fumosorosea ARSEF 2679]OAA34051.1 Flavin monooxygenase-like protein [Cordyceps fumosorosea ARSEF 2679]
MTISNLVSVPEQDVIIVGAGFGGCYALHTLREHGYSAKILDACEDFGGVWHINRYPGARVDSETPTYQFSTPAVRDAFNFSERYPSSMEMRKYFLHMSTELDLRKDTLFNQKVIDTKFDEKKKKWVFKTEQGLTAQSRFAVFATGSSNKAFVPEFKNKSVFKGQVIHPKAWPDHIDLTGKKVGIIGQGASGVQIVQELAKTECELTVFVRTPPHCLPMGQRRIPVDDSDREKSYLDAVFQYAKYTSTTGYHWNASPGILYDKHTPEQRRALWETLWRRKGFAFLSGLNYADIPSNEQANRAAFRFLAEKNRARMTDEAKKNIIAPLDLDVFLFTLRPTLEQDYYEMIDRPNVRLVSLKTCPIAEFAENGIITTTADDHQKQTLHELDVIISATGYDAVTGALYDMNIRDRHGVLLQDKWHNGIFTYLGMMVPDMPNAFIFYGPQAPTSLANGPPFLELQAEFLVRLLERAKAAGRAEIETTDVAAQDWRVKTREVWERLLARHCQSWWVGANVPGKTREPQIWFGGLEAWRQACDNALKHWTNFV